MRTTAKRTAPVRPSLSAIALLQGVYYLVTGLWPLLHMRSFLAVTGPKTDLWLVRTVGVLVSVIGGQLIVERRRPLSALWLALGSCFGLAAIDAYYSLRGRISAVYLLDSLAEIGIAALWITFSAHPSDGPQGAKDGPEIPQAAEPDVGRAPPFLGLV